ncbi:hypothetical protein DFH06DRAFT_1209321 [Mycena polygramma]|nr:hypothetical protein DFH06DRAFT_1209321 [Mycena polygramma]
MRCDPRPPTPRRRRPRSCFEALRPSGLACVWLFVWRISYRRLGAHARIQPRFVSRNSDMTPPNLRTGIPPRVYPRAYKSPPRYPRPTRQIAARADTAPIPAAPRERAVLADRAFCATAPFLSLPASRIVTIRGAHVSPNRSAFCRSSGG